MPVYTGRDVCESRGQERKNEHVEFGQIQLLTSTF